MQRKDRNDYVYLSGCRLQTGVFLLDSSVLFLNSKNFSKIIDEEKRR
jgi:hypothetical protein